MEYFRICPRCKSRHVTRDLSVAAYGQGTFFNQYVCDECGYTGIFFPEVTEEALDEL